MCSSGQSTLSHWIIYQNTSSDNSVSSTYSATQQSRPRCITSCCYKLKFVQRCTMLPHTTLQHCKRSQSTKYHKMVRAWNKAHSRCLVPHIHFLPRVTCIFCPVCVAVHFVHCVCSCAFFALCVAVHFVPRVCSRRALCV